MKRICPIRYKNRYVCLDGMRHEWFLPICKTLFHSLHIYFAHKNIKKEVIKKFVQKPIFVEKSFKPKITWLGHSTFLIQIAGKNIVTDPIFGSLSFIFRRLVPGVVQVCDLPKIDYVLISHNHLDHMDSKSLHDLKQRFPDMHVLVPDGDKAWFDRHAFEHVSEFSWWQDYALGKKSDVTFTFLPANHWSQRTLFDKNRSLWGSWMIQADGFKIYFAGDTSWGDHFEQIGKEFGSIDIACMPIAPGEPRSWMKETHINAREAVKAFIKLKAKTFIPMHWGTFHLGYDDFYTPLKLLQQSWLEFKGELHGKDFRVIKFGEYLYGLNQAFATIKSDKSHISL